MLKNLNVYYIFWLHLYVLMFKKWCIVYTIVLFNFLDKINIENESSIPQTSTSLLQACRREILLRDTCLQGEVSLGSRHYGASSPLPWAQVRRLAEGNHHGSLQTGQGLQRLPHRKSTLQKPRWSDQGLILLKLGSTFLCVLFPSLIPPLSVSLPHSLSLISLSHISWRDRWINPIHQKSYLRLWS